MACLHMHMHMHMHMQHARAHAHMSHAARQKMRGAVKCAR